jgi:hypothetical protein
MNVKQDQEDFFPNEAKTATPKKGGIIMAEDDLEVGQYICVYNLKHHPESAEQIMGQSMLIKAVCLPYIAAELQSEPQKPTLTLDVRFLNLMRVTKEYVEAQSKGACPVPKRKKADPPS